MSRNNKDRERQIASNLHEVEACKVYIKKLLNAKQGEIPEIDLKKLELAKATLERITELRNEIELSAMQLNATRDILLGLSERITIGDARLLQSILANYGSRLKRDKRNEAVLRHLKGLVKELDGHVEEELIYKMSGQEPTYRDP